MDKKTKELLRKRKKVRPASSSESSSSSDSDSGSSSDSYSSSSSADKKGRHHRGKKGRPRRSSSSSDDEKARKREKHACHRKAEAKRSHLKRKQKEAKAKKRALSPGTLEKKHHHHQLMKERHQMREREKLRLGHASSKELLKARLSPSKAKLERHHHHQLSPREKIIIRRERSPPIQQILSPQRGPKDIRHRLEDRRSERERIEAARQKEREEALARCQERQRERERIAKEKIRRERQEKEYDPREQRLLPRPSEREMAIAAARGQDSRERSVDAHADIRRSGHSHSSHRLPHAYERSESDYDREYELRHATEHDRHAGDIDREYMMMRRRGSPSPGGHYKEPRVRGSERELYPDDERYERGGYTQSRSSRGDGYVEEITHRRERESDDWEHERGDGVSGHELREHHPRSDKHLYEKHRSAQSPQWEESNWKYQQQQHLRLGSHKKIPPQIPDENWDEEVDYRPPSKKPSQADWAEGPVHHHTPTQPGRIKMEHGPPMKIVEAKIPHEGQPHGHPGVHIVQHPSPHSANHPVPHAGPPMPHPPHGKRWPQQEWRPRAPPPHGADLRPMHPGGPPGPRVPGYRAPMHRHPVGPINYGGQERPHYPPRHAPPHMQAQHHLGAPYHPRQHFPPKRQMVYTNPNLIANQKAAAAAAASPNLNKPNSALVPIKLATASPTFVNPANKIALIKKIEEQKEQEKLAASNEPGALTESGDAGADEMEPGEIKSTNENEGVEPCEETSGDGIGGEGETRDDLSEISDEADDILKEEKNRQAAALVGDKQIDGAKDDTNLEADTPGDQTENDDLLDFEEISDGELEEETRKNLGDALGVDWASLIKESKIVKGNQKDKNTTAKQKWQPHRVILDVGVSMKYAGKEFAEELLKDAQLKLDAENVTKKVESEDKNEINIKVEDETTTIKIEKLDPEENDGKAKMQIEAVIKNEYQSDGENEKTVLETSNAVGNDETNKIPIENLSELACVQVVQRKNKEIQNNLVFNACGMNSRALSARKDLRLRRQLCGLPVKELECGRVVSEQMKALALKAFQKAVGEVK